jgi:carbohydrate-selective porin OprB
MCNITRSFTVQPDIQGVFRPNGTGLISNPLVLAIQVTIAL